MTAADELQFNISWRLEDGNLMIEALAECPFKLVYELIGKLNRQANSLLQPAGAVASPQDLTLSAAELKLLIHALGNLPYNRVHLLLHDLHRQMQKQMQQAFQRNAGQQKQA
jgi:hypothetical protein